MRRAWRDPRDGTEWAIDALPFDVGPTLPGAARNGWTLVFVARDEHRTLPVGYAIGAELEFIGENLLIALLDAARSEPVPT